MIAPVNIGTNAIVGAGSAIYEDVPDNALSLTRAPQITKEGWASEYRRKHIAIKNREKNKEQKK